LRCELRPRLNQRLFRIEAGFPESRKQILTRIKPVMRLCDDVNDLGINAKRLPRFAQRTARSIG